MSDIYPFTETPLGDLATLRRGITYKAEDLVDRDRGVPYVNMKSFLKGGGFNSDGLKYFNGMYREEDLAHDSDLLIANTDVTLDGDIVGIPAYLPDDIRSGLVLFSHHVTRLRLSGKVEALFLYYLLSTDPYRRWMHKYARGTTVLMLDMAAIKTIPIRYPDDKLIQKKVTNILQTIDEAIEKTEALIEKYSRIKAGMMHDLFTRGLTPNGKLRPPRDQAPELYHETPIGWIPKDWDVLKISDLAHPQKGSTVIGPFGSDLTMSDYRAEGVPVIFVRDVKEDKFKWVSNVFVTPHKAFKLRAHKVGAGDLLVTKMGLPPCVSCVYPQNASPAIITADIIRMTPDKSKVSAEWLSAAINHDRSMRQIAAITAGVTRPKVTLVDFRALRIAVPDLSEQDAIVSILLSHQQTTNTEEESKKKLILQKFGLMHDLLTGKVQVEVNEAEAALV